MGDLVGKTFSTLVILALVVDSSSAQNRTRMPVCLLLRSGSVTSRNSALMGLIAAEHFNSGNCSYAGAAGPVCGAQQALVDPIMIDHDSLEYGSALATDVCLRNGGQVVISVGTSTQAKVSSLAGGVRGLMTLSPSATSPDLSSVGNYPFFLRTIANDVAATKAVAALFGRFGWNGVFLMHVNDDYGSAYVETFKTMLDALYPDANVGSVGFEYPGGMPDAVHEAKESGARILVFITSSAPVDGMFFTAEDAGLFADGYAWICTDSLDPRVSVSESADPARLARLMSGLLRVVIDPVADLAVLGGLLDERGVGDFDQRVVGRPFTATDDVVRAVTVFTGFAYDAMWAACLLVEEMARRGEVVAAGGEKGQELARAAFDWMLENATFTGVTGPVDFNEVGDRDESTLRVVFYSYREDDLEGAVVGEWTEAGGVKLDPDATLRWPGPSGLTFPGFLPAPYAPDSLLNPHRRPVCILVRRGSTASRNVALMAMIAAEHFNQANCSLIAPPSCDPSSLPQAFIDPIIVDHGSLQFEAVEAVRTCSTHGGRAILSVGSSTQAGLESLSGSTFGMVTLSPSATSPDLSSRTNYPHFARTIPNDRAAARAITGLFEKFGWSGTFFVHVNDDYGFGYVAAVKGQILDAFPSAIVGSAPFLRDDIESKRNAVELARNSGARIIVAIPVTAQVDALFFAAEDFGLFADGYAWVSTDAVDPVLSLSISEDPARLAPLLSGLLRVVVDPVVDTALLAQHLDERGVGDFDQRVVGRPFTATDDVVRAVTVFTGFGYDAMWAIALALDAMARRGDDDLDDSGQELARAAFDWVVENATFTGVTGPVDFNEVGDRDESTLRVVFYSYREDDLEGAVVGEWTEARGVVLDPGVALTWPGPSGLTYPGFVPISFPVEESRRDLLPLFLGIGVSFSLLLALGWALHRFLYQDIRSAYAQYLVDQNKRKGPPGEGDPVVLCVTDIQNSTGLWDRFPEEMARGLLLHDRCLRGMLPPHFGYEVATEGDSFQVAFHDPVDAIEWCLSVQLKLMAVEWPEPLKDGGQAILALGPSGGPADSTHWAWPGSDGFGVQEDEDLDLVRRHASRRAMSATNEAMGGVGGGGSSWTSRLQNTSRSFLDLVGGSRPGGGGRRTSWGGAGEGGGAAGATNGEGGGTEEGGQRKSQRSLLPWRRDGAPRTDPSIWCGLRVRMGVHIGIPERVVVSRNTNRNVYEGAVLTIAKLISDSACGGMVVCSGAVVGSMATLDFYSNEDRVFVHLGQHVLKETAASPAAAAAPSGEERVGGSSAVDSPRASKRRQQQQHEEEQEEVHISIIPEEAAASSPSPPPSAAAAAYTSSATTLQREMEDINTVDVVLVVPVQLSRRCLEYPRPKTVRQLTPAYYQSPAAKGVTIVFTFIEKASEMLAADRSAMEEALQMHNTCIRHCLVNGRGYECEEQLGNFLLVFHRPLDALLFCVEAQRSLMEMPWSEGLLSLPEAARAEMDGAPVFAGLRVKMGVATGDATHRMPSSLTGRADYFGPLLNHAARIAVMANGGQVVASDAAVSLLTDGDRQLLGTGLVSLGKHTLKGTRTGPTELHQVQVDAAGRRGVPALVSARPPEARPTAAAPGGSHVQQRVGERGGTMGDGGEGEVRGSKVIQESALAISDSLHISMDDWSAMSISSPGSSFGITPGGRSGGGSGASRGSGLRRELLMRSLSKKDSLTRPSWSGGPGPLSAGHL